MSPRSSSRLRKLAGVSAVVGSSVLLMLWYSRSINGPSISSDQPRRGPEYVHDLKTKKRAEASDSQAPAEGSPSTQAPAEGHETDAKDQKVRPHPDSPARTEMLRARMSFEMIDTALAAGDTESARKLLTEMNASDLPRSRWEDRLQGYAVLLECALKSDHRTRAAAQDFITSFPASPLRRKVRRECLTSEDAR